MPLDRIDGEILFDIDINAVEQVLKGTGWISGWAVTAVSGQLKVSVAEGSGKSEGTVKSTSGATEITLDTADATHPRKDLIVYDVSASALAKVTGIAAGIDPAGESNPRKMKVPKPPDLGETTDILIACVYVPANCTDADNCTIIDKRVRTPASNVIGLLFLIDGAGSAITTGIKGDMEIPFACTLIAWTLIADQSGAIKIDVWKDTYANFPPDNDDSITNGHEPEIAASGTKAQDTDISDWTTVAVAIGDILRFNIDSCATITRATLILKATKA